MKLTNKILEAVNKGIKFALDDFEDQEDIQGQTNSKVKYQGGIKEWLDLMNDVVDLGLPSGTLWRKCNLGAKHEYDYGDYYAWGELTTKDEYNWNNYTYNENDNNHKQLSPECDIATQKLGDYYSIPTKEQCEELIKYTECKWVKYNKGQVYGCLFIGKNGNQLFIPAAGEQCFDYSDDAGFVGTIWTNTDGDLDYAWSLTFNNKDKCTMCTNPRVYGYPVRPVINL